MELVFGAADGSIPIWEVLPSIEVMINNLSWRHPRPRARRVWVDSGGYQAMVKGIKLSIEKVVERYRKLDADLFMSLDIPPRTLCPEDRELVKQNIENFDELRSRLEDREIVPVVHCYSPELMLEALDVYQSLGAKIIAFGGAVPPSMARMGRGSRLAPLIALAIVVKASKRPVHALGIGGSVTMYTVLKTLGAHSADSSSWRVKAAYGKVLVPGLGERYVGDGRARFGRVDMRSEDMELLKRSLEATGFPYMDRLDEMLNTFRGRAIINAWIIYFYRDTFSPRNGFRWMLARAVDYASRSLSSLIAEFEELIANRKNGEHRTALST